MATKGNEENIEELKNIMENSGAKTVDITDGSKAPTEEDMDGVARLMCHFMDFYPKFCDEIERLIKPFIKTNKEGKKCIMYMEDAFLECEKKLPKYFDDNNLAYQQLVKGKFTLQQENIMYTYIGNSWLPLLIVRCLVDVAGNLGAEPVFKCTKVKIVTEKDIEEMAKTVETQKSNDFGVGPKGVVN